MPDYSLCGWQLRSDRPLPFLAALDAAAPDADINVVHAAIPAIDQPEVFISPFVTVYANGQTVVRIGDSLSLLASEGRDIVVDAAPRTSAEEVMTFLLGPALGLICHQKRVLPLHGATIRVGERTVTLVGNSGAGKSTTATALMKRGHRLLCDDISVIHANDATVQPSYPGVKLWQDAADTFSIATDSLSRTRTDLQKFHYPAEESFDHRAATLNAIVILEPVPNNATAELTRHNKLAALAQLGPFIYRRKLAKLLGAEQACFSQLGKLVSQVPVMTLTRPSRFLDFDNVLDLIENSVNA